MKYFKLSLLAVVFLLIIPAVSCYTVTPADPLMNGTVYFNSTIHLDDPAKVCKNFYPSYSYNFAYRFTYCQGNVSGTCTGVYTTDYLTNTTPDGGVNYSVQNKSTSFWMFPSIRCNGDSYNMENTALNSVGTIRKYWNITHTEEPPAWIPDIDFTGYPLDGYSPLEVSFTDTSNQSALNTIRLWTFGDGQIGNVTEATTNHTYENAGIYSVRLDTYSSEYGWYNLTKTNYVLASIPTGMIVNLDVKNAITGALIQDSTVSIRNVTSGVWRNTTAPTGLVYFSTTDPGYLFPLLPEARG